MPKNITMLSTGGTIASKRNPETGLLSSGLMTGEELSEKCALPNDLHVKIESVFQIPSNHMTFEHLFQLKTKIEEVFQSETVDGIVVTHGTDTLEETAYFLDLVIADARPVVVTGSQRGPDVTGSDAFVNLRQAFLLAASSRARNFGTVVLFNERIFSARYVKKQHAANVDGFTSYGFGYLGTVDQDDIYIYQKPVKREAYTLKKPLVDVEIIKTALGSDGKFIDYAVDRGVKGIVIEAAGRGHVPPSMLGSIQYARDNHVVVVLTTSAEAGAVKTVYDFPGSAWSLQNMGVILAGDYDSKKARIKLAVILAVEGLSIEDAMFNN